MFCINLILIIVKSTRFLKLVLKALLRHVRPSLNNYLVFHRSSLAEVHATTASRRFVSAYINFCHVTKV